MYQSIVTADQPTAPDSDVDLEWPASYSNANEDSDSEALSPPARFACCELCLNLVVSCMTRERTLLEPKYSC